jgi:hypothetical protein
MSDDRNDVAQSEADARKRAVIESLIDRVIDHALQDPRERLTPDEFNAATRYLRSQNWHFLSLVADLLHGDEFEATDDGST